MAPDELQRIRDDLQAFQSQLADWETSCLKSVADLLDSLEAARSGWHNLRGDLTRTRDERQRTDEQLSAARREIEGLRSERDLATSARETLATALEELQTRLTRTEKERATLEEVSAKLNASTEDAQLARVAAEQERNAARAELETVHAAWKTKDVEQSAARAELEDRNAALDADQAKLAANLEAMTRERDELIVGATAASAAQEERDQARARIDVLQRECEQLRQETEEQLLQICDMRVSLNRLEAQRDEAVSDGRRKAKKILTRIHEALDAAGTPRGNDLSFGERVRRLAQRIPLDDPEPPQATV